MNAYLKQAGVVLVVLAIASRIEAVRKVVGLTTPT